MKRINQIILIYSFFFLISVIAMGAPIIPIGPVEISGTVSEIKWVPEKKIKGIPRMSGSLGHDRIVPAHFLITLTNYKGVDSKTAITMTRYLDWSALQGEEKKEKPPFILLKINHSDKEYLKRGMKIKVIGYTVRGDEGGTWTSYKNIEILGRGSLRKNIQDYLQNHIESPNFGGKMFCSYELFGTEMKDSKEYIYLWTLCMEYYIKNGNLLNGTGVSMPVVLIAIRSHQGSKIVKHQKPVDGEGYSKSITEMFPKKYHKNIFAETKEYNRRAESLMKDTERQARIYYKLE